MAAPSISGTSKRNRKARTVLLARRVADNGRQINDCVHAPDCADHGLDIPAVPDDEFQIRMPQNAFNGGVTVNQAIEQAEALVAKHQRIKTGLMQDLLTRGIDEHGCLRDPVAHPEQFQDSVLGRIPKDWRVYPLSKVIATIFDYRGRTPRKLRIMVEG